jgi:hypothetical protein
MPSPPRSPGAAGGHRRPPDREEPGEQLGAGITGRCRSLGDGGLPLKRHPASVGDADKLNHERHTGARHHGLGHDSCKLGPYEAGERLHGETVR